VLALLVGVGGTALVLRKPKAEAKVQFHIETEPPGAQVVIAKVIKGVTPLELELDAVEGRAQAEVTLQKEGYLPMTVTAAGSGPRIELIQKLQAKPPEPEKVEPKKDPITPTKPVDKVAPDKPASDKPATDKPPKVDPIDKAFDAPTKKEPVKKADPLPTVTPVKSAPKVAPKKTPPPAKPDKKPPAVEEQDPLAPHTPPPANDLKRPK
jgi:hypothetical protein